MELNYEGIDVPDAPDGDLGFIISKARYAKGQAAVKPRSDGSGVKTRAMFLCCALKGRWSNREKSYIMSPTKAARLQKLFIEGWNATIFGELIEPGETELVVGYISSSATGGFKPMYATQREIDETRRWAEAVCRK